MRINYQHWIITVFVAIFIVQPALGGDLERRQAKRIYDRLTGIPPTNSVIDLMETDLLADPTGKTAAQRAINDPAFYNITLKNFAAAWTNEEQTVFTPLNDYTATVIGMVRDGIDFRQLLYGDILYRGSSSLAISPYSTSDNRHYEELEALGSVAGNLADSNILIGPNEGVLQSSTTGLASSATAGIITSRAAAMAFFVDGTNRAMFRFTLINHLCTDLEPLKDVSRSPDHVRQDVSRSPGGDSRLFLNACVGCHAGMDGMAGAFAYYEWKYSGDTSTGHLDFSNGQVQSKNLINSDNFKRGHITTDDSWINYWRNGQNAQLGWGSYGGLVLDSKNNATGNGAKTLGMELANTRAFAQCQVDKAFETICLRDPNTFAADRSARDGIIATFSASGYDMREVFTDVAAYCKGG